MNEKLEKALKDLARDMSGAFEEPFETLDGITTLYVNGSEVVNALNVLKQSQSGDFDLLVDLTAIDWLPRPDKGCRFEVVYLLCSTNFNHRIRLKVRVSEEDLTVPSCVRVYQSANWMEREVYDMFGVSFRGHPDLRRILMWDDFEGHPLRKDFPTRGLHPIERTPYT